MCVILRYNEIGDIFMHIFGSRKLFLTIFEDCVMVCGDYDTPCRYLNFMMRLSVAVAIEKT